MIGAVKAADRAYELEKRAFSGDLSDQRELPMHVSGEVEGVLAFVRQRLERMRAETGEAG
jgi:hypothetical protein